MHSFILTHAGIIATTLIVLSFILTLPSLKITKVFPLNVQMFLRWYVMDKLSSFFCYNPPEGEVNRHFINFKSGSRGKYFEVTRPRSFKVLDENDAREKLLDFNSQFVRNRLGIPKT